MNQGSVPGRSFSDFIENGDFDWPDAARDEQFYFREVCAAFLRATFEPPAGYAIEVIEAEYRGKFPVIVLSWSQETESLSLNERREFIRRLIHPLNRFVQAVDWSEVAHIRADAQQAPGVAALQTLLRQYDAMPLAQRSLKVLADPAATILLAPQPLPAREIRDIHSKRAETGAEPGQIIEDSQPFLPALTRMAEAGEQICIHSVTTKNHEQTIFIVTDVAMRHLVAIRAVSDVP